MTTAWSPTAGARPWLPEELATPRARKPAAKTATAFRAARGAAFQKGLQDLARYTAREGRLPGRAGVERLPDGDVRRVGVWLANQRRRRDRIDQAQRATLAELGVEWAQ
ncbi:Helicase associated domain protein [Streptomyces kutzneri]|uniref:Helicase associated domain protein n=1 Tax=Streptomyces kutzneri TaxID=3051179 RepID=UPI0034D970B4